LALAIGYSSKGGTLAICSLPELKNIGPAKYISGKEEKELSDGHVSEALGEYRE